MNQRPKFGPVQSPFFDPMRGYDAEGKWMGMTPEEVKEWVKRTSALARFSTWKPPTGSKPS